LLDAIGRCKKPVLLHVHVKHKDYLKNIEIMNNVFYNYEFNKLNIVHPDYINYFLIVGFIVFVFLTSFAKFSEVERGSVKILNRTHTQQLRGLAIFLVVLGHLWVHVSKIQANLVLSGEAVSLFLILSGFGLFTSVKGKNFLLKKFFIKRVKRVMVPYWIVTFFIILIDCLILNKKISFNEILLTFIGINITEYLLKLDYVRWFVTFILLWYINFTIFYLFLKKYCLPFVLLIFSVLLIPIHYYYLDVGWYNFFSFPVGCLIALNYEKVQFISNKNLNILLFFSIIYLFVFINITIFFGNGNLYSNLITKIPNILLVIFFDFSSVLFSISLIIVTYYFIKNNFHSFILSFLGKYSYELFLVHGIFLIKYNFFINSVEFYGVIFEFLIFFTSLLPIIVMLKFTTNKLNV